MLTEQQKIGHLLRRFGFGASLEEREKYYKLGLQRTIDYLIDFDEKPDTVPSWRAAFLKEGDAQPGGYRFKLLWIMEMLITDQPLREKLALFWHDHFAIHEEDVAHGLAVHDYMMEVRHDPAGKFRDILGKMSKSSAVMRQLNIEMLTKATPNENFARELLELYTLGIGHYSEEDILHISRALTGWSYYDVYWRLGETNNERVKFLIKYKTPAIFFISAPSVHIDGPKEVLGKKVDTPEDVLDLLADHPQTALHICSKLWEWFAYMNPERPVVERLANVFKTSKGDIRAVLREMTRMNEFWSERCYRSLIKNPVDYVVGIARAQNVKARLMKDVDVSAGPTEPLKEELTSQLYHAQYYMDHLGMDLLYAPSVAGWDWGKGWISTNTVHWRRQYRGLYSYYASEKDGKKIWLPDEPVKYVCNTIISRNPKTVAEMVDAFLDIYDCPLSSDQREIMEQHFTKAGGIDLLKDELGLAWRCTLAIGLMAASPQFQVC